MLPNRSVCANSSLFDSFQPVLFGQCYGVNREETDFLGRGKAAALCRLVSTVFWTIAYTMMYDVIVDPFSSLWSCWTFSFWSFILHKSKQISRHLDIPMLIFIICLGWIPLLLDVITATINCRAQVQVHVQVRWGSGEGQVKVRWGSGRSRYESVYCYCYCWCCCCHTCPWRVVCLGRCPAPRQPVHWSPG